MAPFRSKVFFGCLLVLVSAAVVRAEDSDDEATVEVEEEVEEYTSPEIPKRVFFAEHFDDAKSFGKRWVKSEAKKQGVDENIAKYDGKWELKTPSRKIFKDDLGLVLTTEAKHAAISALLDKPFEFKDKPFVVQYEVTMQEGQNCGGAYIKLLSRGSNTKADLRQFHDQTPYTIMFGPDKCGNDNKLHFIFRHKNPKNGTIEEKHSKKPTQRLDEIYKDKQPHLYTLIIRPDNTFTVLVDSKEVNSGSLLEDFTPAVNPPEEIDDPNDTKPDDWDEREKIVDPTARKPSDWDEDAPAQIVDPNAVKPTGWLDDEPENIPDPEAKKPSDWDEEMDGEWEAPLIDNPRCGAAPGCGPWAPPTIPNPDYKGVWRAPLISNPNYRGKWAPRRIPNPHYFRDEQPFQMTPIHAVGLELWSMSPALLFDNLIITDDELVAELWAAQTFKMKRAKLSRDSKTWWGKIQRLTNYNPGYWAMYAVYCSIPIAVYIALLVRRAREESFFERALQFAGDNPWVYAVVIFGSFIVVGVGAYLCCGPRSDPVGESKKSDAVVEDDAHESDPESDGASDGEAPRPSGEAPRPSEGEAPRPSEGEAPRPSGKASLEGHDETHTESDSTETTTVDTEGAGDGQRKRKARKE